MAIVRCGLSVRLIGLVDYYLLAEALNLGAI
jgi:hypothetical protein